MNQKIAVVRSVAVLLVGDSRERRYERMSLRTSRSHEYENYLLRYFDGARGWHCRDGVGKDARFPRPCNRPSSFISKMKTRRKEEESCHFHSLLTYLWITKRGFRPKSRKLQNVCSLETSKRSSIMKESVSSFLNGKTIGARSL